MTTAYQKFYEVIADNHATSQAYILHLNQFLDYSKIDSESIVIIDNGEKFIKISACEKNLLVEEKND